jgi:molybdopterin converting factor small subunit
MNVRVELYAALRELTGVGETQVSLPDGSTVETLLRALYERFPAVAEWDNRLVTASGLDYVERAHAIHPGEIISILPSPQSE